MSRAAASTAGVTLAALCEPPETGALGKLESPICTVMRLTGRPSASAATCAMIGSCLFQRYLPAWTAKVAGALSRQSKHRKMPIVTEPWRG
jgi:hypothetical protein